MKQIYEVACPHCRHPNKLPTDSMCPHCGGALGLFAGLHTLLANDDGRPEIGYSRALSDAEVLSLSLNPWQLYDMPLKVTAGPNVRVKPDTTE